MEYDDEYLEILEKISKNLKKYRSKAGLTQEQVAEIAGFNVRYYQRLEAGQQSPNLLTLYRSTKSLGITINMLFR